MDRNSLFFKGHENTEITLRSLGDIEEGRGDLGTDMPVIVYRLMQFTMQNVLSSTFGVDIANELFRQAGFLAGYEFAKSVLNLDQPFPEFIASLQRTLQDYKIGIMRMESFDNDTGEITLTVAQDLDCSGLPITNENVCLYDEGFFMGILESYTGKKYDFREVDCWANGDRVCRFMGKVEQ